MIMRSEMSLQSITLAVCISLVTLSANAEIYRSTDAEGNVVYSDQPRPGSKTVDLPGLTSYQSPAYSTQTPSNSPGADSKQTSIYSNFNISSPANDETVRANSGEISVSISLSPGLKAGHIVVINMDGQIFKGKNTLYNLSNVDRGTHVLKAHVEDAAGEKQTDVVSHTFHLKRTSVNSPANKASKP